MIGTKYKNERLIFSALGNAALVNIISCLYILLLFYAVASKLMEYDKFSIQIGKSSILTDFAPVLAWLVPATEITIAVLLIFPRTLLLGLYASFTLMAMFTAYIFVVLNFSETIPCSCGGILQKMSWTQHLIFNMVFLVLAAIGILKQNKIIYRTGIKSSQ